MYLLLSRSPIPWRGEGAPPTRIEPETCRPPALACIPNQGLQKASVCCKAGSGHARYVRRVWLVARPMISCPAHDWTTSG